MARFNLTYEQAIARLLYARRDIVILDDPFSALDKKTQNQIVNNLFGWNGIFRQRHTTVLWISNNTNTFRCADGLLLISDSRIIDISLDKVAQALNEPIAQASTNMTNQGMSKIQLQDQKLQDLAQDMNRKTGDTTLYGRYAVGLSSLNMLIG